MKTRTIFIDVYDEYDEDFLLDAEVEAQLPINISTVERQCREFVRQKLQGERFIYATYQLDLYDSHGRLSTISIST